MISAIVLVCTSAPAIRADELLFQSGEKQTALIELFTSEGCSSCPPAEVWLGKLVQEPGLWKEFVPVSFHVDYWDGLGWKDRFASPVFTQRQRDYAQAWGSSSVYTPGFVVNGLEQRSVPSLPVLLAAKPGVLKVSRNGEKLSVQFLPGNENHTPFLVRMALLGSGLVSKVQRGENSGHELKHDFLVLSYERRPLNKDGSAVFDFPTTISRPARLALAVWITKSDDLAPVQAAGGWLQ